MNAYDPDAHLTADDAELFAQIARAAELRDPVPEGMTDRIIAAVSLTLMEAELAVLVDGSLEAVRWEQASTVTFSASSLSLMVTLTEVDGRVRIDGWVTGGGVLVELHAGDDVFEATSDATGRLVWPSVPHGPVRFRITPDREGARPVITPTIEV